MSECKYQALKRHPAELDIKATFPTMKDDDREKIDYTAELTARAKSLEQLYDYTKFHIGVYLTLTTAFLTVANIKLPAGNTTPAVVPVFHLYMPLVVLAVACFLVAGFAGGVIVSSITQTVGGSSQTFLKTRLGPWSREWWCGTTWTYIEHTSFWLGLLAAIAAIAVGDSA